MSLKNFHIEDIHGPLAVYRIYQDEDPSSPREWDNLGTICSFDRNITGESEKSGLSGAAYRAAETYFEPIRNAFLMAASKLYEAHKSWFDAFDDFDFDFDDFDFDGFDFDKLPQIDRIVCQIAIDEIGEAAQKVYKLFGGSDVPGVIERARRYLRQKHDEAVSHLRDFAGCEIPENVTGERLWEIFSVLDTAHDFLVEMSEEELADSATYGLASYEQAQWFFSTLAPELGWAVVEDGRVFFYATAEEIAKEFEGQPDTTPEERQLKAVEILECERATWKQWREGDVYGYVRVPLADFDADVHDGGDDSCWGFFGIKDVRSEVESFVQSDIERYKALRSEYLRCIEQISPDHRARIFVPITDPKVLSTHRNQLHYTPSNDAYPDAISARERATWDRLTSEGPCKPDEVTKFAEVVLLKEKPILDDEQLARGSFD